MSIKESIEKNCKVMYGIKMMRIKRYFDISQKLTIKKIEYDTLQNELLNITNSLDDSDIEFINYIKERI